MTVSFSQLGAHGRLANQLFQVISTIGIAERNQAQAVFPEWKYEQYFDIELNHGEAVGPIVKELNFEYNDYKLDNDCDLFGYFQSEKYFGTQRLKFKREATEQVWTKMDCGIMDKETILIHIRRGDFVNNPHYHQLPVTYYINALTSEFKIWQDCNIIVISDDLAYAKLHFQCLPNVYFADDLDEIESMALASMCDHFILSNSSYSWWCAWLGEKEHSKIVHPGHLFAGPSLRNDTKDFWPERWVRFQQDSYKIDLMDTTFTIPVFYDHKDRKQNLDLSVCMLQSAFDTNIVIGEQGSKMFEYMQQHCQYRKFDLKTFHRTKMLNDMALSCGTEYVANWDCDVIITPMQILMTVLLLRGGADMVFPYDGRFARLPRHPWFELIRRALDLGVLKDHEPHGKRNKPVPISSVGGAVFFNVASFIKGGMENENMVSFGPEDCERNDRFTTLGYRIERVGGCLYHIDHFIGPNSSTRNPYFKANHAELEKIRALDAEGLKMYVRTWPWVPIRVTDDEVMEVLEYYCRWAEGVTGKKLSIMVNHAGRSNFMPAQPT